MKQLCTVLAFSSVALLVACGRPTIAPVVFKSAESERRLPNIIVADARLQAPQPALHPLRSTEKTLAVTFIDDDAETLDRHSPNPAVTKFPAPVIEKQTLAPARIHKVQSGDTLHALSGRYGVTLRTLIDANQLQPPFDLRIGQNLQVPEPRYHFVQQGETVYGVSRQHDVDMASLVRENAIPAPYRLQANQRLLIPWSKGQTARYATATDPQAIADKLTPSVPQPRVGVKMAAVAPDRFKATGRSPKPSSKPGAVAGVPTPSSSAKAEVQRRRIAAGPSPDLKPVGPLFARRTTPDVYKQPPRRSARTFAWPVDGKVLSRFGPKQGGKHNDGINLAAPFGTPIKAAENGVVAYVGNELKSYGNLILIRHANGWTSAYAHTSVIHVNPGTIVRRGDVIAAVGASGNVVIPQIHFELRKGKTAVDPVRYLAPSTRLALNRP